MQIMKYLIAGCCTTAVGLGVYCGLVSVLLDSQIPVELQSANVISWIAAVTFAYVVNRKYVFNSRNSDILREGAKFYLARVGSLMADMMIMFIGVTICGANDKFIKFISSLVVIIMNYLISKLYVFSKSPH